MRSSPLLLATLFAAAVLAGCTSMPVTPDPGTVAPELKAGPALWNDPQNAPHPAWGWATLSNPPAGAMPSWWTPVAARALPEHITGMTHLARAMDAAGKSVPQGAGIAIFGHIAVVPEDAQFAHFVDVSDPMHPVEVGKVDSTGRGAAIIAYPTGRLVTAISTTPGFDVIDFTDPTHPETVSQVKASEGGHKLGIVPGTPILYNAGSNGGEAASPINPVGLGPGTCSASVSNCVGYTSIYDLTDPANPALVQEWHNGLSCHHIFFWNNATQGKYRAICAGIQYTQLWDTTDPKHPSVIVSIPVHSGVANGPSNSLSVEMFSHSAGLSIDGKVLYVGDESGGGGLPPGCVASASLPTDGTTAGTPVGATWFYNVADEKNPQLLNYFEAPVQPSTYTDTAGNMHSSSCTTHHGRLVPDKEGRDLLAMSYYGDGVILVDFTGVSPSTPPKMIDQYQDDSNTWETWYDNGYLFTGDLARGLDSLTFR